MQGVARAWGRVLLFGSMNIDYRPDDADHHQRYNPQAEGGNRGRSLAGEPQPRAEIERLKTAVFALCRAAEKAIEALDAKGSGERDKEAIDLLRAIEKVEAAS